MRVFAIADPHLSRAAPKPMTIFGEGWAGHPERFFAGWRETVAEDDLVLVPGDVSWAMTLGGALPDLLDIAALPGQKVLLRGNHDYWWPSLTKLRAALPEGMFALQNDALRLGSVVVAGTRGWVCPGSGDFDAEDEKIYTRELGRLQLSLAAAQKLRQPGDPLGRDAPLSTDELTARALRLYRSVSGRGGRRGGLRASARRNAAR